MLHIAITAGGTSENMDGIRKITNVSTGLLGWYCLKAVLHHFNSGADKSYHVHYLHTENAVKRPLTKDEKKQVTFIPVTDAASVYKAVDTLTKEIPVDYFIHSMAIADFTFSYAAAMPELAEELYGFRNCDGENRDDIAAILENPLCKYNPDGKISSDSNLIIGLKRTKKVIPLIKKNNPETFLVGFKLLKGVTEDELISVANRMAAVNGCDMVLANDVALIGKTNHQGILIKNDTIIDRPRGKEEIAKSIVRNMLSFSK